MFINCFVSIEDDIKELSCVARKNPGNHLLENLRKPFTLATPA